MADRTSPDLGEHTKTYAGFVWLIMASVGNIAILLIALYLGFLAGNPLLAWVLGIVGMPAFTIWLWFRRG